MTLRLPLGDGPLLEGRLLRRYKRFLSDIELDGGRTVTAHCPNPGSMAGLLKPGARVLLSTSDRPTRKLAHTWELVRVGRVWVGVNTARPNQFVGAALAGGHIPELAGYPEIRAEVRMGDRRRVDFLLSGEEGLCYVEVKNVTLADGRTALFPDSVTARGTAHLEELAARKAEGHRAVMLYVVNRSDCLRAGPAGDVDPVYARTLREAVRAGVETIAYRARNGKAGMALDGRVPFEAGV